MNKFPSYDLQSQLGTWITSFLSNRSLTVVVDSYSSDLHKINVGVPQGYVLAPTLFLLRINDLLTLADNPIYSFADDNTLHSNFYSTKPITSSERSSKCFEMNDSLSQDLTKILKWGNSNLVQFNTSKTPSCSISRKTTTKQQPNLHEQPNYIQRQFP